MAYGAKLKLVAAILALGAAPPSRDDQFFCHGEASGAQDERVSMFIHVERDGTRVAEYASWTPPEESRPTQDFRAPSASLDVSFDNPTHAGLGPIGGIGLMASVFMPKVRRQLDGARISLEIDGLATAVLPVRREPLVAPLRHIASRFASLGAGNHEALGRLKGAKSATITLADRNGRQLAKRSYDLSHPSTRDQLFAQAWKQATNAARQSEKCERTVEAPKGLTPPIDMIVP